MSFNEELSGSVNQEMMTILKEESDSANEYRMRSEDLFKKMMSINGGLGQDDRMSHLKKYAKSHMELLNEMLEFEKNVINNEIMFFFYATIARTALNSRNFELAVQYAQAGIEANEKTNDQEGVLANKRVLLDAAVFSGSTNEAVRIIEENEDLNEAKSIPAIKQIPSVGDNDFKKFLKRKKRPESLKFCLDPELMHLERAMRIIMRQMGISKKEAMQYKNLALEMIEKEQS